MTDVCAFCGEPAFPHPYRHPLILAEPKTPFELEQDLEMDHDNALEQMANVAAEWKSYYWRALQEDESRKHRICQLMRRAAECMYDGVDYKGVGPYYAALILKDVADILEVPSPHDILDQLCEEDDS